MAALMRRDEEQSAEEAASAAAVFADIERPASKKEPAVTVQVNMEPLSSICQIRRSSPYGRKATTSMGK